jgi:hypothetical protein
VGFQAPQAVATGLRGLCAPGPSKGRAWRWCWRGKSDVSRVPPPVNLRGRLSRGGLVRSRSSAQPHARAQNEAPARMLCAHGNSTGKQPDMDASDTTFGTTC